MGEQLEGGKADKSPSIEIPLWRFNPISVVRKIKKVEQLVHDLWDVATNIRQRWVRRQADADSAQLIDRLKTRKIRQVDDEIVYKQAWRRAAVPTKTAEDNIAIIFWLVLQQKVVQINNGSPLYAALRRFYYTFFIEGVMGVWLSWESICPASRGSWVRTPSSPP